VLTGAKELTLAYLKRCYIYYADLKLTEPIAEEGCDGSWLQKEENNKAQAIGALVLRSVSKAIGIEKLSSFSKMPSEDLELAGLIDR
jgi:hypothetical protein